MFGTFFSEKFFSALKAGVLANFFSAFYGVIDLLAAGMFIGSAAVNAVEIVFPVKQFGAFVYFLFLIGAPIIYGEEIGRFDKKSADGTFSLGMICTMSANILYVALVLIFKDRFLDAYAGTVEVRAFCDTYLKYLMIDLILRSGATYLYYMLMMDGDTKTASAALVAQFVVRTALAMLLTPVMGIAGIGLAAVISVSVLLIICLTHFLRKNNTLHFGSAIDWKKIPKILKYSIIDSVSYALSSVLTLYLNASFTAKFGADALLLASAVNFVCQLFNGLDGVGIAMEVMVNIYSGEKSYRGVCNILRIGLRWALVLGTVMVIAMFILAGWIAQYLGITEARMAMLVTRGIRTACLSCVIMSVIYCLTSFYLYVGRLRLGVLLTVLASLMPIAGIEICTALFKESGAFIGVTAGAVLSFALILLFVRVKYGKARFPYAVDRDQSTFDDRIFEYELCQGGIIDTLDGVEAYLTRWHYARETVLNVRLLLEEMLFCVLEENAKNPESKGASAGKKRVLGECAVILGDDISVVLCDNGVTMDLTDPNRLPTGLRSYVLSLIVESKTSERYNLITIGSNRCAFTVTGAVREEV